MRREKIEAEVEFKPKGLAKLRAQWLDFGGDLVEPVALLAAGATKVEAAWAGVRGIFLTQVLGPLGMVAGVATGFLLTTKKLVGEWKELGMRSAAALERMTLQFRPLLGSMDLARKRVKELFSFTAETPFRLEETAAANKMLQALTRGALATTEGMTLVGDSAAVAGAGLQETARYVGRLYDGLLNGRPVGEAAMRMQELGLISGQTRNQIESMEAANVSGLEIWRVVEKELQRNKGAMKDLSQTLEGLESTAEDVKQQMEAGFSQGFMEGEKAGIQATTQAMERLTPVAEYFGEVFGGISNVFAKGRAQLLDMATSFPGFTNAVKLAAGGMLVFTASIVTATGAAIGRFIAGIVSATAASGQLAKSTGSVAAAEAAETAVSARLTVAKAQLAAAKAAVARGSMVEAAGATRVAAVETVAAMRTNALAASQMILRGAFRATAGAIRFVVVQLRAMLVAIVTNPWMLLATALVAVGAYLMNLSIVADRARKALEGYKKATDDLNRSLGQQMSAVQTVTDLRKLEAELIRELAQAYRDLETASAKGDDKAADAARQRVEEVEARKREARGISPFALQRGESEIELERFLRDRGVEARLSREDFEARGPEEKAKLAERRLFERTRRRDEASGDIMAEKQVLMDQAEVRRQNEDRDLAAARMRQKLSDKRADYEKFRQGRDMGAFENAGEMQARGAAMRAEISAMEKQIREMEVEGRGSEMEVALSSDSELARLRAQVALYDDLQAKKKAEVDAREKLAQADKDGRQGAEAALQAAQQELAIAEKLDERYGRIRTAAGKQGVQERIADIERKRKDDMDPVALERARQQAAEADYQVARAKLDSEEQVASLRLRGFEAEKAALDFEREKLELARERERIGRGEYDRSRELLDARRNDLRRRTVERGTALQLGFEESRLRRLSEEARRGGDGTRARALEREADDRLERRRRQELEAQARGLTSDPASQRNFVESRLREERSARAADRREERRERELDRRSARADVGRDEAELRAKGLRAGGRSDEARAVEEAAARRQDAVRRERLRRQYLEDGFGAGAAEQLAGRQVKVDQANRLLERFGRGGSAVVADSLARVAGGGGVAGRDRDQVLLEQIKRVLDSIEDNTAKDVDFELN